MKLESELRDREHLLIDMRNKLATLEAQMEYVSYSKGYTLSHFSLQWGMHITTNNLHIIIS